MENTKKEITNCLNEIKEVYEYMIKNNLDVIEYSNRDEHIKLVRKSPVQNVHIIQSQTTPITQTTSQAKPQTQQTLGDTINSPMSGIFYRASSPSSPPYVREGDIIEANTIVCLIEAMKVFNEIKSDYKCKIIKCFVENGKFVNEGEPLFSIEKL